MSAARSRQKAPAPEYSGPRVYDIAFDADRHAWLWCVWYLRDTDKQRNVPRGAPLEEGYVAFDVEARAAARHASPPGAVLIERPGTAQALLERRAKGKRQRDEERAYHQAAEEWARTAWANAPPRGRAEQAWEDWFAAQDRAREARSAGPASGVGVGPGELAAALATLGLAPNPTADEVRKAFRRAALATHPDQGGTAEAFIRATKARDVVMRSLEAPLRATG